jgi:hypothetical protein
MWIFLNNGFVSIVDDARKPGNLMVRARHPDHILALLPYARIDRTVSADYRYRTSALRAAVAEALFEKVFAVTYPNFKNSISDPMYHEACSDVWGVMFNYQLGVARGDHLENSAARIAGEI